MSRLVSMLLMLVIPATAFAASPQTRKSVQIEIARVSRSGAREILLLKADGGRERLWSNSSRFFSSSDAWVGSLERPSTGLLSRLEGFLQPRSRAPAAIKGSGGAHGERLYVNGVEVDPASATYSRLLGLVGVEISTAKGWKPRDAKRARLKGDNLEVETRLGSKPVATVRVPYDKACRIEQGTKLRCTSKMGWHVLEMR